MFTMTAAWTAVSALSERSIAGKSTAVDFPDFTRGAWKNPAPLGIVSYAGCRDLPSGSIK